MRGIEAALKVISNLNDSEKFGSELLRKLADREKLKVQDISLASSLIYITMRRKELWQNIANKFLKEDITTLNKNVRDCLTVGTGGLLELRRFAGGVLVSGIIDYMKKNKLNKNIPLVNAILHRINEHGRDELEKFKISSDIKDRAMFSGVPVWSLPAWERTWQRNELLKIFDMMIQPAVSSIRVMPGKLEDVLNVESLHAKKSDLSDAVHLNETISPKNLPGFNEGFCTLQSESSILTASLVKKFYRGGLILDMCSGRGVKAGQILQEIDDVNLECWEISEGRHKSALKEIQRLKISEHNKNNLILKLGNALNLNPSEQPKFILLDAPCSGSGTWNRKPESKWRLTWEKFDKNINVQKKLLNRALELCAPGGYILYITCSLFKQENENITAEAISKNNCADMSSLIKFNGEAFKRGRPWGVYILPYNSWLDGFYCALIMKKEA